MGGMTGTSPLTSTLSHYLPVKDWIRRKKHLELLSCRDTFFQNTGYYCRLIRLSDGLCRDTHPRKSYDQALMDGIKQAIILLS